MTDAPFPEAFVINLDHRTDRWAAIEQTCKAAGICPVRIPAVQTSPGHRGCAITHVQCIRLAKEKALPWVLILEDDATFSPEAIERFRALLPYLWQHRTEWERFNGGPAFLQNPHFKCTTELLSQNPPIAYTNGFMAHFNLIHSGAYDMILQYGVDRDRGIDWFYVEVEVGRSRRNLEMIVAKQPVGVLDGTFFNSVATYPHISVQRSSYSDMLMRESDYSPDFRYAEQKLHGCFTAPSPQCCDFGGFLGEESFCRLYAAAQAKEQLGSPEDEVIDAYLEASRAMPTRAEALHGASRYCRFKGHNEKGFQLARKGLALGRPSIGMFVESWIYDYGLLDELAINGYWSGHYRESLEACIKILGNTACPPDKRERIAVNAMFALKKLPREA